MMRPTTRAFPTAWIAGENIESAKAAYTRNDLALHLVIKERKGRSSYVKIFTPPQPVESDQGVGDGGDNDDDGDGGGGGDDDDDDEDASVSCIIELQVPAPAAAVRRQVRGRTGNQPPKMLPSSQQPSQRSRVRPRRRQNVL
eukprot:5604436-Pleurochrysis_carterae.AAC.2